MSTNTSIDKQITSQEARAFVLSSIAISSGVFGIAFWYGVFGTVFFEHLFYVWVASTVALISSLFVPPLDALPGFEQSRTYGGTILSIFESPSLSANAP